VIASQQMGKAKDLDLVLPTALELLPPVVFGAGTFNAQIYGISICLYTLVHQLSSHIRTRPLASH